MGFTEYTGQAVIANNNATGNDGTHATETDNVGVDDECGGGSSSSSFKRMPDQEILDGMEEIYFQDGANCEQYELEVC